MALRLHVDPAETVHPKGVLDAVDVLGRREKPDHVVRPRMSVLRLRQLSIPAESRTRCLAEAGHVGMRRVACVVQIDRTRSAARIEREIETLSGAAFTTSREAIRRYAYTPEYRRTLDHFTTALEELGFTVTADPVGTLVARNRPPGEPAFGIGSHCDSNRNGGRYDGTMGVVTALEVCRLAEEHGLGLPLQLISFVEEEGSGFGQMLLGSRIMLQRVSEHDLRERFLALDDGRSFWEHAESAGYEPGRWRESIRVLDGLTGWIEMHIEQARVLQDTGKRDRRRERDRGLRPRRRARAGPG